MTATLPLQIADPLRPQRIDTPQSRAWHRFRRHRLGSLGLVLLLLMVFLALAAPWIAPWQPHQIDLLNRNQPPSSAHWLGTDEIGRDTFSRLLYAGRISLSVGLVAVGISVAIGVSLGAVSGYYGGRVDSFIISRCRYDIQAAGPGRWPHTSTNLAATQSPYLVA